MANIDDCFRDFDPHDLEEMFRNSGIQFSPRDAEKQPMVEAAPLLNPRAGLMNIVDYFRPKMEVFKGMQAATNIPFYDWWSRIEDGRAAVEAMTHKAFGELTHASRTVDVETRKMAQLLLEAKYQVPEKYAALRDQVPADAVTFSETLEGIVQRFVTDHAPDEKVEDIFKLFPKFRKSNGVVSLSSTGQTRIPAPITRRQLSEGLGDMDERDLDPATILRRYFRAVANEKHLAGVWDEVDVHRKKYGGISGQDTLTPYFGFFDSYRKGVQHLPDSTQIAMAAGAKAIMTKLFGREVLDSEASDVIGVLTSANYHANMAFQVGMVARNYLQTLQTTYPVLGGKYTRYGLKQAVKWYKDPEYRAQLEELGVVARDAYAEPLREVARLMTEKNPTATKAMGKFFNFLEKGTTWYQTADNFNKVAAYEGQKALALARIAEYKKHGNFAKFFEDSKLDMRDAANGPLTREVKRLIDSGREDVAAHLVGMDFAKASQFVYSRGNEAQVFSSSLGRLFGQYGTWPSWYANYVGTMFGRYKTRNGQKAIARWVAVNAAMYYGMAEAFNVEFARWTFFAPLAYQGGPIAQIAGQAADVVASQVSGEEDPVARINAGRLQGAARQVLPFPTGALNTYMRAYDEAQAGNWAEASRRFMGLPTKE